VLYPWGGGGKFLINSLGVATNACFQDIWRTRNQMVGLYNSTDKKNLILDSLKDTVTHWVDFNMGANVLTGVEEDYYISNGASTAQYWPWHHEFSVLTNSPMHFFLDTHSPIYLKSMLKVWPCANVIVIEDCQEIYQHRNFNPNRFGLQDYWDNIRGDESWPEAAPETWPEIQALPWEIIEELDELFGFEILRFVYHPEAQAAFDRDRRDQIRDILEQYPNNRKIELSGSMYMSATQTQDAVKQCYQLLGLEDFDIDFVNKYYTQWFETISRARIIPQ
jgi:hypothetical protein